MFTVNLFGFSGYKGGHNKGFNFQKITVLSYKNSIPPGQGDFCSQCLKSLFTKDLSLQRK